jgi:hypothetical protein
VINKLRLKAYWEGLLKNKKADETRFEQKNRFLARKIGKILFVFGMTAVIIA